MSWYWIYFITTKTMQKSFIESAEKFCRLIENLDSVNFDSFRSEFFYTSMDLLLQWVNINDRNGNIPWWIGMSLVNNEDLERIRIQVRKILQNKIQENIDNEVWEFDYLPIDAAITVNITEVYLWLTKGLMKHKDWSMDQTVEVLRNWIENEYGWNISNIVCILSRI